MSNVLAAILLSMNLVTDNNASTPRILVVSVITVS